MIKEEQNFLRLVELAFEVVLLEDIKLFKELAKR